MSTVLHPSRAGTSPVDIGTITIEHGGALERVRVAYEINGPADAPAVLVLGGISSGRHLIRTHDTHAHDTWWPGVAGAGCALDPDVYRLISIDYVGGRGDSTHPAKGEVWPAVTTSDHAAIIVSFLDRLGIDTLHAVVGASSGGMIGLALAARFPERVERVVAVGAAHRSHPMATALRSVQRRTVRLAIEAGVPQKGVAAARALAMSTYRTAAEFDSRFRGAARVRDAVASFPVDDYLDHHARGYADSFPAECFLVLSQSLDLHNVDPALIRARTTLICFDSDTLVPLSDVRALACAIPGGAVLSCIPTQFGHDGFLKEPRAVNEAITAALTDAAQPAVSIAGAPPPLGPDGQPVTRYAARTVPDDCTTATRSVRAGVAIDTQHGAVIPPIHLSTTFTFNGFGGKRDYDYTRSGNPTRDVLAAAIADLEHGAAGIVTPTGMAAVSVTLQLLRPGDLLVAAHDGYGGTYRLMQALARKHAFNVVFVDLTRPVARDLIRTRRPRMVWIETPSNPLLRITDIDAVATAAHDVGAICITDNTFLSPALQNPIDLGSDIVIHSTTKYLNGHSDVVGGAIVANDVAIAEELGWWANCTGATGAPFDSYLTLRGIRTLQPRIRTHEENARAVVDLLCTHPAVRHVYYPGIATHEGHDIAARQQRGFGAMISFELDGGEAATRKLVERLRYFTLAESLGGVESLIAHPASMTHAAMDPEARRNAGISDDLLRLSVGIEATSDLVADLEAALSQALHAGGCA